MQELLNQTQKSKSNNPPAMEFDIDSFEFKPVTKGLGFHQDKIKESSTRKFKRTQTIAQKERIKYEERSITINNPVVETKKPVIKEELISKKEVKVKNARMGLQFTSFVFDFVLICLIQLGLNFAFLKLVQLDSFSKFLEFTWKEQSLFFSFLFLFYFTILELASTPGKRIFDLKLDTTVGKKLSIDQTLIRSVVTLLSFLTAGMPLLFDFQGKLSDTRVIENA
ncbi:MAG: putative RDD family membrane protein YckC [Bacteriovoracaceae bacterium]|jgi:uncharacterized RDD family membrane protein YckC